MVIYSHLLILKTELEKFAPIPYTTSCKHDDLSLFILPFPAHKSIIGPVKL